MADDLEKQLKAQYGNLPLDPPPMKVGNDRENDPKEPERKPKVEK